MIGEHFKIAWRNLKKNKVYSFINIFGLALGMATTILIGLWIFDEFNFNRYFTNHDKIGQIYQNQGSNGDIGTGEFMPRPMEFVLRESYTDNFKHIAMASNRESQYLKYKEKNLSRTGNYLQEEGLKIFEPEIIKGVENGLIDKNSIMISESTAKAIFGNEDPIGKIVQIDSGDNMIVTSVYLDFPVNTSFKDVHWLIPWKHYVSQSWLRNSVSHWGWNSFQIYAQISDNLSFPKVNINIADSKLKANKANADYNPKIFLLPMKDWHLRSVFENGVQSGGRIENVWLFAIIGAFVLFLACINFMNLSTARSEKRAMEVGIRKAIGSDRKQLITQFLMESLLVVALAFMISILLVVVFLNPFNELASKEIQFPWANGVFWICSMLFIAFTATISGSYPALYLSSFKPVKVLKGTFKGGKLSALPRKILVVTQFTVSIALIIGTMIVMSQILYSKDRPLGYNEAGLIQIPALSKEFNGKSDLMRNQFIASGGAIEMGTSSNPTTRITSTRGGFTWEGKPEGFQDSFVWTEVSYDYVKALGMEIVEGRDFSREFATDSSAFLINETAQKYMGLTDPIGKLLKYPTPNGSEIEIKIIGVVNDVITDSPYSPIQQQFYVFDRNDNNDYYNLRLNPDKSITENLSLIEKTLKQNFPNLPFSYEFIDEEYAKKFAAEERVASLAMVFTILAVIISCLGIFGLASYMAEQRKKEIGIRKVLGATINNLWLLLSKDFIMLVLIAILIAAPIAYMVMNGWLQKFIYRTEISWLIFISAGLGAIVITLITVSFQSIKAARANPTKSLSTE